MTMVIARSPRPDPVTPRSPAGADGTARAAAPPRGSAERAAVLTLVAAIAFQPILHPTGPGNSSPVDVLTVASIVTALVWMAGTHRKLRAPYFFPVTLYVAAGAASGLVSSLPNTALLTLAIDALLFTWCLAVVNVLSAPRAMRYAVATWSWSGIAWAAVAIIAWAGHITFLEGVTAAEGNRVMFTFGDPNYASWYWGSTILVVFAARTPAKRWIRVTGYLMLLWALILTESNGGMLALCAGVAFLLLVRGHRRHGWAGVVAAGLSVGLAVSAFFTVLPLNELRQWAANSNQPLLVNSIGRSAQSTSERSLLIRESIQLYERSDGIFGVGPASTKPLTAALLYPYANEAHDDYLAALSERGALGLFAFLLLAASAAARAAPVIRRPLPAPFAAAVPRPAGIVAALITVSLNSFYEEVQHFRPLWLLLAIVAVLGRAAVRTRSPARVPRRPAAPRPGGGQLAAAPGAAPGAALIPGTVGRVRRQAGSRLLSRNAMTNLGAQAGALAAVSLASLLVARTGGPTVVGEYTLIRVLPWLFGVIFSGGLPTASAFFLAGKRGEDPRARPTVTLIAAAGAGLGSLVWLACAVPFRHEFFRQMPAALVLVMAALVVTQLWTVTAKACCQGSGDIAGANLVIVAEELWFVFVYPLVLLTVGYKGATSVLIASITSGMLATATGLLRLLRRGYFTGWGRPSPALAKKILAFGGRGQLGNMLWLMNLRFDFVLLGALAGPTVLGIYAVASKVAELMRLAPTAINYVLYSRFARLPAGRATAEARHLLPRALALTLALTPLVAAAAYIGLPIVYGDAFRAAIAPAEIIIIGLSVEGAAAVSSAFLVGRGRPGVNSIGMGVGAAITVTMDAILIPRYGAFGGAVTSAVTYLTTTMVLVLLTRRMLSGRPPAAVPLRHLARARAAGPWPRGDSAARRAVDVVVAGTILALISPLLLVIAAGVRLTSRGPALYQQARAGRQGRPFTMLKFRSMVPGADQAGPLVTARADPRVTRVGRWLRATKLDELPQLINVLRGDMTLIGPRPEVPRFIRWYSAEELQILQVRPGLTGPGQIFYTRVQESADVVVGDPELHYAIRELHPKLAIDLAYLRHRSVRSDLAIVFRTAWLLTRRGKRLPLPGAPLGAQSRTQAYGHHLDGAVAAKLRRHIADIRADRVRRLVQLRRDPVPVHPADHQAQDLPLARGEPLDELLALIRGSPEVGHQLAEQSGGQPGAAERRGPHRAHDLLDRRALGDETDRAGPDSLDGCGDVRVGGQHDDRRRRRQQGQPPGELDAAYAPQADIHQHRVRLARRHDGGGLLRVGHDHRGEVRLTSEKRLQALGENPMVIDDEQLRPHCPSQAFRWPGSIRNRCPSHRRSPP
jgi:lipopolysaccharide/colanic/teichoic acid biosynthesis glycosyltransferase/O-antigen/teichoic acid export membrane protein